MRIIDLLSWMLSRQWERRLIGNNNFYLDVTMLWGRSSPSLLCAERRKGGRVMRPPRIQLRMNTRRSALIPSAFVVIMPCGKPG